MKIAYLAHRFYPEYHPEYDEGGAGKFVYNMARMMQMLGHKTKVITYSFYENPSYDKKRGEIFVKEFSFKGVPVLAFKYKKLVPDLHSGLGNEQLARISKKILEDEEPEVVHVGHPMTVGEFIKSARSFGIPYIITLTDFWLLCPKGILFASDNSLCLGPEGGRSCLKHCPEFTGNMISSRLRLAKEMLSGAKMVTSPSRFVAGIFSREWSDLKIGVINHGLNYGALKKNARIYRKGDKLTFFYGGSLDPHKGVHVLLNAFLRIRSDNAALKIYGTGDEQYTRALKKMASGDGRIEFCGVYSEDRTGDILGGVDAAVVPSLWFENYPLVLHEALACNVPVIASNAGGMAEKIKNGATGFTFRIGDPESLKEVLEMLIDQPEKLNAVKDNLKSLMIPTVEQEALAYERELRRIRNAAHFLEKNKPTHYDSKTTWT